MIDNRFGLFYIFILIVILSIGAGFLFSENSLGQEAPGELLKQISNQQKQLAEISKEQVQLQSQIDALSESLKTMANDSGSGPSTNEMIIQVNNLSANVVNLQAQINQISETIQNDPNRVVTVPLLRKDFDNFTLLK